MKAQCFWIIQEIACARDRLCRGPGCSRLSDAGHHIYGRVHKATAFDPQWVMGLCYACHDWAGAAPQEFMDWAIYLMGEEEYYHGLRKSNTIVKHQDYRAIYEGLKRVLAVYKRA